MGRPQDALRCVHVAGTNGKGSTCALLERMLRACGLKTGLYTSPYLMRYNERMRVNGVPISDDELLKIASLVRSEAEALVDEGVRPTWFELGTAIAFEWFRQQRTDVAIIEVGLGGRLDPTNVIAPVLSVIGPIDLEHTKQLGDTRIKIAYEKAGTIKPGVPCVVQRQASPDIGEVFYTVAAEKGSPLVDLGASNSPDIEYDARGSFLRWKDERVRVNLPGRHQGENACLAITAFEQLHIPGFELDRRAAMSALSEATWPGRLEWIDELSLMDGAHNAHGAQALRQYCREFRRGRRIVCLIGCMKDKDVRACAEIYASFVDAAVATNVSYGRALAADDLAAVLREFGLSCLSDGNESAALEKARSLAGDDGVVLVCGSLYLAGDIRLMLKDDGGVI